MWINSQKNTYFEIASTEPGIATEVPLSYRTPVISNNNPLIGFDSHDDVTAADEDNEVGDIQKRFNNSKLTNVLM
mgnify:FL=1